MIQTITRFLSAEPLRLLVSLVAIMSFVGLNAAYLVWVERKGAGRFQRRPGPTEAGPAGLLQPIADALKLLSLPRSLGDAIAHGVPRARASRARGR